MRPLRLELKGFTAFRDKVEIDFEGLDLFAISGQTGSGKSSILDAMTYALYGYIERVGKQAGRFVSQGQLRMAVSFEFRVDEARFRVTRSTPAARGQTKILLERHENGEWRQAGEGADRVREADAMIRDLVGLEYDAFTRTALLPQGKFAEFLVGDAKDRRKILTELLGLELFGRLGRRAGELRDTATLTANTKESLLQTEYGGVGPGALDEAESAAEEARVRDGALIDAEKTVKGIAQRWERTKGEIRDLTSCAREALAMESAVRTAAEILTELAEQLEEAETMVNARTAAAAGAAAVAEESSRARAEAEAEWGRMPDLVAARTKAEGLAGRRDEIAGVEAELTGASAGIPMLEEALIRAEETLAVRSSARETAEAAVASAGQVLERARHANLVAAVRAGAHVGEACPVCGSTIESLPKSGRAPDLEKATAAHARAEKALASAEARERKAERAGDAARSALDQAGKDLARLSAELKRRRAELDDLERALSKAMGGKASADFLAELDDRIEQLEARQVEGERASAAAAEADQARMEVERARDGILARAAEERARLEAVAVSGLVERARAAAGADLPVPGPAVVFATPLDAGALGAAAVDLAEGLDRLAADLDELAERRAAGEGELLAQANEAVSDLLEPFGSLGGLVEGLADARRRAAATLATTEQLLERLREQLDRAGVLTEEIGGLRNRAERFGALALELRQDRLVAFLQLEALQVLAKAGSDHLATLSGKRYGLAYEDDEFFVVDTWNGDESRSARTLSGGETFLASLALALALSEQVQSLSVTEKARLDSLFLDEGFGTLDPETLEVVVDAIEQLGGDGRMVGVITHVQELAIRLPARIEVEKSPRGSRLVVVS